MNEVQHEAPDCTIYIAVTKMDLVEGYPQNGTHHGGSEGEEEGVSDAEMASPFDFPAEKRAVSECEIEEFATQTQARVFETSGKTGVGVNELFEAIARDLACIERPPDPPHRHVLAPVRLSSPPPSRSLPMSSAVYSSEEFPRQHSQSCCG